MNKLKIVFDNTASSAPLTVMGRSRISIPGNTVTECVLPESDQTRNLVSRLRREYPSLKISMEQASTPPKAQSAVPEQTSNTEISQGKADPAPTGKGKGKPEQGAA